MFSPSSHPERARAREREDNGRVRENPGNGVVPFISMYPDKLEITKGYGVRATTIEGQNAFHVRDSQNTRDQITSDRRSKHA